MPYTSLNTGVRPVIRTLMVAGFVAGMMLFAQPDLAIAQASSAAMPSPISVASGNSNSQAAYPSAPTTATPDISSQANAAQPVAQGGSPVN